MRGKHVSVPNLRLSQPVYIETDIRVGVEINNVD